MLCLSLVYRRDPFLARCYIQCTHPLLARLLDAIRCSITFMLMTLSYYITFRALSVSDMNLSNVKLVCCVRDMDAWVLSNKLKLNKDISLKFLKFPLPINLGHHYLLMLYVMRLYPAPPVYAILELSLISPFVYGTSCQCSLSIVLFPSS